MMMARFFSCSFLILLVACGNDAAVAPTPLSQSLIDSWGTVSDVGGDPSLRVSIALVVHSGGAQLELPCGAGTLVAPLVPDGSGHFEVPGTFSFDNCGPLLDVTYEGWTDFEHLEVHVLDAGGNLLEDWPTMTRQVVHPARCSKPCSSG